MQTLRFQQPLLKLLMSVCTLFNFAVKEMIVIFPNGSLNGGVSSLVMSIMACAAFCGVAFLLAVNLFHPFSKCSCCCIVIFNYFVGLFMFDFLYHQAFFIFNKCFK